MIKLEASGASGVRDVVAAQRLLAEMDVQHDLGRSLRTSIVGGSMINSAGSVFA
jgi:hypothetical protein